MRKILAFSMLSVALAFPSVGHTQLAGKSITGTLIFGGNPNNLWANPGPTEISSFLEFIQIGQFAGVFANWDDTGFNIEESLVTSIPINTNSWIMTFTSIEPGIFTGLVPVSNTFPGLGYHVADHTITVSFDGNAFLNDKFEARFDFAPPTVVPEPGTYALMLTGLGLLGCAVKRRRST